MSSSRRASAVAKAGMEEPKVPDGGNQTAPTRARRSPRTQEARSLETQAKVVLAASECIAKLGFRGATMGAIANRAGVSLGAIQHQFGEKDALLDAVLEEAIRSSRNIYAGLREDEPDPAARVRAFIARSGELLRGPIYRSIIEIQVGRSRAPSEESIAWSRYLGKTLSDIWSGLFGDLGLDERRLSDAQRFTFAVLSGIAAEAMLFQGDDFTSRHLEMLEKTLLGLLGLENQGQLKNS
jgi:AcrR family transcriptional regulator